MTIDQQIRAQAAKTAEDQIERSAQMYEGNPALLDMIEPGLAKMTAQELRAFMLQYLTFERLLAGGEVPLINLQGALRYALRLEQNKCPTLSTGSKPIGSSPPGSSSPE
jgi:hypothetical protein